MQKKTTLEVIAPTVEDAISQGLEELGLTAADVSVEVLDSGGKGFLGLGKREVRVRLTVNSEPMPLSTAQAETESIPNAPVKKERSVPKVDETPSDNQTVSSSKADSEQEEENTSSTAKEDEPLLSYSKEVVTKLLELMHLKAEVSARYDAPDREGRKSVCVEISGKDLGVLIGRRGETINAFQRIAALIVSKEMSRWVRLSVDVEGHRSRREQQLRRMARQLAQQVAQTGRRQSLEPMPANERRIVHMELQNHADVKTNSIGEDPQRKVMIEPKN
jgi:spoIIIJ-associated protein